LRKPRVQRTLFALKAPEVRYAKSGEVSIAYSVVGDGPFDVVFVNGWVFSALEHAWEGPSADLFRRLASFSRLILFDKQGTRLSDHAADVPDLETRMDVRGEGWRLIPSSIPPLKV
jgi:pimeloyl-ACP methyl ester carboxylesterase